MNREIKNNWVFFLAALLLLGAFGTWPYVYYQLLRWVVFGVGIYASYQAHETNRNSWVWLFGAMALLFNPILPFYMERETWQVIDLTAALLLVSFIFSKRKQIES